MKNLRIYISGKVYKTGFLFYTKQFSQLHQIKGSAKYLDKTTLLIEAEGTKANLSRFLSYCKLGPPGSIINNIKITEGEMQNYRTFNIIENISS